jgi:glycosyltransferase involved in cell wall biosynthesis
LSSTRIKVLFVTADLNGGGAERVLLTVLRHLDRELFEPSLFLLRNEGVYWDEVSSDVHVTCGVAGHGSLKLRAPGILRKLLSEVDKTNVVVGALELLPSYFAYVSARLRRKPAIAWVHSDIKQNLALYRTAQFHRWMVGAIYPNFRQIIFPSQTARRSFVEAIPKVQQMSRVIYNPIDSSILTSKAVEPLAGSLEVVFDKPTVVAMGKLVAHKGFDFLLRAHAESLACGLEHNLLILGEGRDRQLLERMAKGLGVSGSVYLPGFVTNPYALLKRASALVVPSRFEAFGMVVLEAMELGVPVICMNSAQGPVEILEGGTYGMCIEGEQPFALASAINALIGNSALRSQYARLGKARVKSFQVQQILIQWKELLCSFAQPNSH